MSKDRPPQTIKIYNDVKEQYDVVDRDEYIAQQRRQWNERAAENPEEIMTRDEFAEYLEYLKSLGIDFYKEVDPSRDTPKAPMDFGR